MVFAVEYVIIVFRSLKPRDSNPVSSPTARPPKVVPLLVESPPARTEYLITCDYLLVTRIFVYNVKRENAIWHVNKYLCVRNIMFAARNVLLT